MSKVLYKRIGNPEKYDEYYTSAGKMWFNPNYNKWYNDYGDVIDVIPSWYMSETPSPELAEILDLLKQHSDREMYTLHKEEIQTLLNELLN